MTKDIPTPPSAEKLRTKVQNAINHPLYERVKEHTKSHDEAIADQEDGKPLGWIIETFGFDDQQLLADPKRVETSCRVFEAIVFAFRLGERRSAIRFNADISIITGWVSDVIMSDTDIHGNHNYRKSLRKALDIADGVLLEVKVIRPVLDEIERWMDGGWGAVLKANYETAHAAIVSYLGKDPQERDKSLSNKGERRFLARQCKNFVWLLYNNNIHDFFDFDESGELQGDFEATFKEHGVSLPGFQKGPAKPLSGKRRVKKPGSASKRKPRVRDEDGKLVKTSTRSLSAREARSKSKG